MSSHKKTDFKALLKDRLSAEKSEFDSLAEKGITPITTTGFVGSGDSLLYEIPITLIDPDKNQIRKSYNEETINELAQSISSVGMLQPVIVIKTGERFKLVTGHRRYFAHKKLKLSKIKAIIKIGLSEKDASIFQLTENLQRENLDPIDEALGLKRIMDEHNVSQQTLTQIMSKDKTYISKTLGILKLMEKVAPAQLSGIAKESLIELSQNSDTFNENELNIVINRIKNESVTRNELRKMIKLAKEGKLGLTEKTKQIKDFEEKIRDIINTTKEISDKVMKLKIQFGKEISEEIEEKIRSQLIIEANRLIELISTLFKGKATIDINIKVNKPAELKFPNSSVLVTIGESLVKVGFSFFDYTLSKTEVIQKIKDKIPNIQNEILEETSIETIIDQWNALPFQKIEKNVDGFYFKALKNKFTLPTKYIELKEISMKEKIEEKPGKWDKFSFKKK